MNPLNLFKNRQVTVNNASRPTPLGSVPPTPTPTPLERVPLSTPAPYATPQPTEKVNQKKILTDKPTRANTVNGYTLGGYATALGHIQKVRSIYDTSPKFANSTGVQNEIDRISTIKKIKVPFTGDMVWKSAMAYGVDPILMMAIMRQDSNLGTAGIGALGMNPGNVGTDDSGKIQKYKTWEEGLNALAYDLAQRKLGKNLLSYKK